MFAYMNRVRCTLCHEYHRLGFTNHQGFRTTHYISQIKNPGGINYKGDVVIFTKCSPVIKELSTSRHIVYVP
jgi:hypothetical protein